MFIAIMGVAGSGKSHIASALHKQLTNLGQHIELVEGDDFHPPENVKKMSAGIALTDDDRLPWLQALQDQSVKHRSLILAASLLKHSHRALVFARRQVDILVHLDCEAAVLEQRMRERDHFMSATLLESQLQTLEAPTATEAVHINSTLATEDIYNQILNVIRERELCP